MLDVAILGQVALGYSPFIDRNRAVAATRLSVYPLRPDASLDVAQLLHAVGDVWPASGGKVSLNVVSESLLHDLLRASPSANLMVEVPNFMASDAANVASLVRLHSAGNTLLLKGRPNAELPREVLPCFKYSIIDLADERRIGEAANAPAGVTRSIPHVQSGVRTVPDMEAAFARGAHAVLGWPIDDTLSGTAARTGKPVAQPDQQVIVELIHRVDNEEPIDRLENTLKRDPSLAFKLLRYINSPAFGLRVEVSSFRHAIMLLGYQRLKRWLALLLGHRQQGRQPATGDVRRGAPRPADGRAGRRLGRRRDEERGLHLRRVLPSRPDVRRAFRQAAELDSRCRSGSTRRWSRTRDRSSPTWRWFAPPKASRCSSTARPPNSC